MERYVNFVFFTAMALSVSGAGITVTGNGSDAETKKPHKYAIKQFTPYRISFEAKKADPKTTGKTICAGLPGLNVDLDLNYDWTSYSDIVMTPSRDRPVSQMPLRFTLWRVSGDVLVRNWKVVEQQAVYATDGTLTLGDGEYLLGNRYVFIDRPGCEHHNHSRPLHSWRGDVRMNTNRYPLGDDGEIIWKHELAGRRFMSAYISIGAGYFTSGSVRVDVSRDAAAWTTVGRLAVTNKFAGFSVGKTLFPAERLFVRVTGEDTTGVQLNAYNISAEVDGDRVFAAGATAYADAGKTVAAPGFSVPEYYRSDYGELVPGSSPSLALWRASSGWRIPQDRDVPTAVSKGLELSMAANEAEAVQLVLTPARTISDVSVSVDIPSLEAEALKVAYVQVDQPVDHSTLPGLYADPLPPQSAPMTLKPGKNQPFWIKVKAPKGTPKGTYRGWVTVRGKLAGGSDAAGKIERKVPVSVEVYGFEFPDRVTCRSLFGFHPNQVNLYHGLTNHADRLRMYDRYMRKFSEYHLSASGGATYGLEKWYPEWNGDEPAFNWKEWDEGMERGFNEYHFTAMRIARGLGLGNGDASRRRPPEIDGVKEDDPRYEVRLARLLKGVQDHLEEKGWLDRVYIYCFDEPPERDDPFVMKGFAKLAKYAPKLRRFLTTPCRPGLLGGPQTWCSIAPDLSGPLVRERRRLGEEFWLYVCMSPKHPYATLFIDHPAVELRTWLWQCWAEKVPGILVWTSNLWTSKSKYPDQRYPQNPYVDAQAWRPSAAPWGNGDGRIFYPPESAFKDVTARRTGLNPGPNFDDPVGSLRGEMLRDGLEDYEYFVILNRLDPSNPLLKVPPTVSRALDDFSRSPAGIDAHRRLLAREIERLSAK